MLPHERVPFSAIVDRKPLRLPGNARLAIWVIVNVEDWDIDRPMPRTVLTPPAGGQVIPDVPNWAWHEYGHRVGFWRIKDILDEHKIPATLALNGAVCRSYPRIAGAARDAGWEFMGHGYTQLSMHKVDDEREAIRRTAEVIADFTGQRPRGWLGPGLTETFDTVDHLAAEGYEYVADWVFDDQPVKLATKNGPLYSIPYTQEINDVAMMLIQHHKASEYFERAVDQFEQLHHDARGSARVMAIAMHPYIMGAPHRAKYFRKIFERLTQHRDVVFWTGAQILDWYKGEESRTS
jgi:peptidoglycan/xylan/chitin deacetylase (PgdA/CDA1 family)